MTRVFDVDYRSFHIASDAWTVWRFGPETFRRLRGHTEQVQQWLGDRWVRVPVEPVRQDIVVVQKGAAS